MREKEGKETCNHDLASRVRKLLRSQGSMMRLGAHSPRLALDRRDAIVIPDDGCGEGIQNSISARAFHMAWHPARRHTRGQQQGGRKPINGQRARVASEQVRQPMRAQEDGRYCHRTRPGVDRFSNISSPVPHKPARC